MVPSSSLADKAFKVVSMTLAAGTVITLGALAVNVYVNSGKKREPPESAEATATQSKPQPEEPAAGKA